jgi:hypothetical protein
VEQVAFMGERIEYSVRTSGGRAFIVFASRRERFPIGTPVDLLVDTTDATVWPK